MTTQRKPSVFVQRMKTLRESREANMLTDFVPIVREEADNVAGVDMRRIRLENETLLKSMSKDEIEEKQRELIRSLNPESIAFLKNRTIKGNVEQTISQQSVNKSSPPECSNVEKKCEFTDPYKQLNINMDSKIDEVPTDAAECEKMKWMADVPVSVNPLPGKLYNARFDFEGNLLPYIIENESTSSKGLYHHGNEPERPGYTLDELFLLSRSSFPRQRVIALNTIAAVLENEFLLSSHLETELLSELLKSGVFLILRFAMDERLKSVYLAALRAISALLWKASDMHYIMNSIGTFGEIRLPSFEVNNSSLEVENPKELTDSELLSFDVIRGAIRTNLVQRLKYILDDMYPVDDRVLLIIKCLTRIAFHSDEAASVIINTPLLLEKLFAICSLPSDSGKLYTAKLLILFRVIACRSPEFAEILCTRFHLVSYLLNIISDPLLKTTTVSQCIYLWHVLLYHEIAVESVSEFSSVLFHLLQQLAVRSGERLEDGDIVLANAFLTLLVFLFEKFPSTVAACRPTLERLGCQWLNLFINGTKKSHNLIKLVSNTVYLLTCLKSVNNNEIVTSLFKILGWNRLTDLSNHLHGASYLLNAVKTDYNASLPSLCIPARVLVEDNNIILLHAIVKCLLRNDQFNECEQAITLVDNLWKSYVIPVLNRNLSEITTLWPSRFEILFLYDVLLLSARRRNPSIQKQRQILQLAFALLRIIHVDDGAIVQSIFNEILFNEYLHDQIISSNFNNVDGFVSDASTRDTNVIYLETVKKIFTDQLNIPKTKAHLISTKRGTECAMPTDWFYVPILKISNAFQDDTRNYCVPCEDGSTTKMIDCILRWIRFVECISDDVSTNMSLSTRFCRICCVFFCGDVFLELKNLLADILHLLLKHNEDLEFSTPIPGLSSFYDFYRELCEQFSSCSYGDRVFGAYLLVPLQQKHDVRLRLYFWNEQTVALRFLTMTNEELPVPLEFYLQPYEKNVQLIETYLNVIARGHVKENVNAALYHIGIHHIAVFLQSYEEEPAAKRLQQKVHCIKNEYLKNCILNYSCFQEAVIRNQ